MTHWATIEFMHYYMGSKFRYESGTGQVVIAKLELINGGDYLAGIGDDNEWYEFEYWQTKGKFQLILIAPEDMTEDQSNNYWSLCHKFYDSNQTKYYTADTPQSVHYLISNHIDAFDLIKYGAAINIKSL